MVTKYNLDLDLPLSVDLFVVLTWDTDMTDVELHVLEPTGEHCHSFYNQTKNGGMLTKDMSRGLGPEVYQIKNAVLGCYTVYIKLFAARGRTVLQPVTARVKVFLNYGIPELERDSVFVVQLEKEKERVDVAKIYFSE